MDVKKHSEQDVLNCETEPVVLDAQTLSERYAERGVAKVMRESLAQQIEREAETCELAPNAYRRSSDEASHGENEEMDASDLLRYFEETRSMRLEGRDFSEEADQALSESDVEDQASKTALCHRDSQTPDSAKGKRDALQMVDSLKRHVSSWIDTSTAKTDANRKPFPLSLFAAIVAAAMSLMLIVASSVIVAQAEGRVNTLNRKIDSLSLEVTDLQADWNVQNDLIAIREIAMKEYGMIHEEYVKTVYLPLTKGESVEVLEEETREGIRLSALLSAIGIDLGE